MSYLSLISCTDLDVLCVATKMRSAYSSVSKRETSFSRIGSRFSGDSNPIIYPVLGFDTRGSGEMREIRRGFYGSYDRPQVRDQKATGPVPREVEQLRVRLLSVEDHGAVHTVDPEDRVGQVLELRRGRAVGRDKPDEHILRPSEGREDTRHGLDHPLPIHGLERVEGHQAKKRPLRLRQLELDVGPFQVRIHVRPFHVKDDPGDLGGA